MKSAFQIEITTDQERNWTASGIDQVVYLISTNPGEPLRRLEHIASGGELSRVMLALTVSVESGATKVAQYEDSKARESGRQELRHEESKRGQSKHQESK